VNDRLQIYVIYSLIRFKMKKIIAFFISFSGISCCISQSNSQLTHADTVKQNIFTKVQSIKKDSFPLKKIPSAKVFPNPAKNKVEIEINGFETGFVQIQLIDKNGKMVRNDKREVFSGNETIVFMFSESPGIYFLLIKQAEKSYKNKLIIH